MMTSEEITDLTNNELGVRLSCLAKKADNEEDRAVIRTSSCRLLGGGNNAGRFFTVEGAKEAFHKEFCDGKCDACPFRKHLKANLGDTNYCFVRWLLSAHLTKEELKAAKQVEQGELFK